MQRTSSNHIFCSNLSYTYLMSKQERFQGSSSTNSSPFHTKKNVWHFVSVYLRVSVSLCDYGCNCVHEIDTCFVDINNYNNIGCSKTYFIIIYFRPFIISYSPHLLSVVAITGTNTICDENSIERLSGCFKN